MVPCYVLRNSRPSDIATAVDVVRIGAKKKNKLCEAWSSFDIGRELVGIADVTVERCASDILADESFGDVSVEYLSRDAASLRSPRGN